MSPLLSISFRPFFILAASIAAINPVLWVFNYLGQLSLPLPVVDPLFWHAHEMIFGFTGALIAGFILTASANWTNSEPYQGKALLILILSWIIERCSYFLPLNEKYLFVLMNLFFPILWFMLLRKLWRFPKQKYVFLPILLGITIGKLFHSYGSLYSIDSFEFSGREVAVGLIRFIVLLIAGRVIPFFTIKKIKGVKIDLPRWINPISLLAILTLAFPWPESTSKFVLVSILSVAIIANISRQIMWKPLSTLKIPILFILHIGIAFINLELILKVIGIFDDQVHYTQAALHMLLAGGVGVVGIGIMTRVSLGHTGRVIMTDLWTKIAFISIISGSILRVLVPIYYSDYFVQSLYIASCMWTIGFLIFLFRYFGILISPRPDGKIY
ncbi:NnrS family protein [Bacteriovoracaceae bacterium]|nr:NnrS family protein [Bacteriovoracaceae bacterium]